MGRMLMVSVLLVLSTTIAGCFDRLKVPQVHQPESAGDRPNSDR